MTILPKKTSQRPPGGGGGATAEGSQEHPQGGHFNISSQVRKGRVYENECLKLDVENFTALTPHPMCWEFFKRVVVFSMSCAKRDPPFRAHLDHFSRLPKLMSGFLCQQEVKFEKSHFEILCNDFLYIWTYP